jgi:hypothetical protein
MSQQNRDPIRELGTTQQQTSYTECREVLRSSSPYPIEEIINQVTLAI